MKNTISKLLAMALTIAFFSIANAEMVLNNSILHFEPGEPNRQDIEVENISDEPLYIKVTPHIVRNPGTDNEQREAYVDPRQAGLLVSPSKLVIPPNGRKLIRFVMLDKNPSKENVYRVAITPVAGDLKATQSGIKILIAYEVLVLQYPIQGESKLVATREGKTLILENQGQANILLRDGIQCERDVMDEANCDTLPGKRLYPGNRLQVDLPHDRPVKYFLSEGTRNSVQVFE